MKMVFKKTCQNVGTLSYRKVHANAKLFEFFQQISRLWLVLKTPAGEYQETKQPTINWQTKFERIVGRHGLENSQDFFVCLQNVCACTCVWRQEINIMSSSVSNSPLEEGGTWSSLTSCQESPHFSCLQLCSPRLHIYTTALAFYVRNPTQRSHACEAALFNLIHLLRLEFLSWTRCEGERALVSFFVRTYLLIQQ